jgi:transcriptional regulator GlxA family with amidase domain
MPIPPDEADPLSASHISKKMTRLRVHQFIPPTEEFYKEQDKQRKLRRSQLATLHQGELKMRVLEAMVRPDMSLAEISVRSGISVRHLQRLMKPLQKHGFVKPVCELGSCDYPRNKGWSRLF